MSDLGGAVGHVSVTAPAASAGDAAPMKDATRLSFNQATAERASLPDVIEACARGGIPGISIWRHKLAETGVDRAARQLRDLRGELARTLTDDRHDVAEPVAMRDREDALQHDEHAGPGLAGREQARALRIAAHGAEAADARDLRVGQDREDLMAARAVEVVVGGHADSGVGHPTYFTIRTGDRVR